MKIYTEKQKADRLRAARKYNTSEKGKASRKRYRQSKEGKISQEKWRKSPKGIISIEKYRKSAKREAVLFRYAEKKKSRARLENKRKVDKVLQDFAKEIEHLNLQSLLK